MMGGVVTSAQPSAEQRVVLQRAHERLRTASKELQSLVATDPIKGRWEPDQAPAEILTAAYEELEHAHAGLVACQTAILGTPATTGALEVSERDRVLTFSFADLMRYHGPGSPGGVAHAFKVMQSAFAILGPDGPLERLEVSVSTAFGGPGARDGFEMVTRAVTGERFHVDPALARPERGVALERFVFRVEYRGAGVTLALREGFVSEEFIALARKEDHDVEEEARLDVLKQDMAERVMSSPAPEVYDVASDA